MWLKLQKNWGMSNILTYIWAASKMAVWVSGQSQALVWEMSLCHCPRLLGFWVGRRVLKTFLYSIVRDVA